jgi:hypothetical protein
LCRHQHRQHHHQYHHLYHCSHHDDCWTDHRALPYIV